MDKNIVSYGCKEVKASTKRKGVFAMKLLNMNKNLETKTIYPCNYPVENVVPARRQVWEGSPWRAFRFLRRG